jgi:ribonuclease PH
MPRLGPRTIYLDGDVLQADGGTRTAAITGAYVALCDAVSAGRQRGLWGPDVIVAGVAAVSVGIVDGQMLLDLDYTEDTAADVDCNLVMTSHGQWVEIQATAERTPLSEDQLAALLALGRGGITQLLTLQERVLRSARPSD